MGPTEKETMAEEDPGGAVGGGAGDTMTVDGLSMAVAVAFRSQG
jgi:hypothetical protein